MLYTPGHAAVFGTAIQPERGIIKGWRPVILWDNLATNDNLQGPDSI